MDGKDAESQVIDNDYSYKMGHSEYRVQRNALE